MGFPKVESEGMASEWLMPEFELHFEFVLGSEMQPRQQRREGSVNPTIMEVLEVIG